MQCAFITLFSIASPKTHLVPFRTPSCLWDLSLVAICWTETNFYIRSIVSTSTAAAIISPFDKTNFSSEKSPKTFHMFIKGKGNG